MLHIHQINFRSALFAIFISISCSANSYTMSAVLPCVPVYFSTYLTPDTPSCYLPPCPSPTLIRTQMTNTIWCNLYSCLCSWLRDLAPITHISLALSLSLFYFARCRQFKARWQIVNINQNTFSADRAAFIFVSAHYKCTLTRSVALATRLPAYPVLWLQARRKVEQC